MPRATAPPSASQSQGNKQTTLLGFFGKAGAPLSTHGSAAGSPSTAVLPTLSKDGFQPSSERRASSSKTQTASSTPKSAFVPPLTDNTSRSASSTKEQGRGDTRVNMSHLISKSGSIIEIDQEDGDETQLNTHQSVLPATPTITGVPKSGMRLGRSPAFSRSTNPAASSSSPLSEMDDDIATGADESAAPPSSGVDGTMPASTNRTMVFDSDEEEAGRRAPVRMPHHKLIARCQTNRLRLIRCTSGQELKTKDCLCRVGQ